MRKYTYYQSTSGDPIMVQVPKMTIMKYVTPWQLKWAYRKLQGMGRRSNVIIHSAGVMVEKA